jgi:hypothetical protein
MKTSQAFTAWMVVAIVIPQASAAPIIPGLLDPEFQSLFDAAVPNALDPGFIYKSQGNGNSKLYKVEIKESIHNASLRGESEQDLPGFLIYGYGGENKPATWPGMTFEVKKDEDTFVTWLNKLPVNPGSPEGTGFLIKNLVGDYDVIDKTLHWAYSLKGYMDFTIEKDGIPVVPHLHGGHTQYQYDGNPGTYVAELFHTVLFVYCVVLKYFFSFVLSPYLQSFSLVPTSKSKVRSGLQSNTATAMTSQLVLFGEFIKCVAFLYFIGVPRLNTNNLQQVPRSFFGHYETQRVCWNGRVSNAGSLYCAHDTLSLQLYILASCFTHRFYILRDDFDTGAGMYEHL